MDFKGFKLDKFQEDAIKSVDLHNSVVVSAATGTGKTLIADYVITKFLNTTKRVIYTAPIKALSNQKFRDFTKDYGDKIGLLTGDVSINERAQVLIMTTEIYRNMLLAKDPIIADVSYVIFDEIHFINDIERGTVWEESIIFSPEHIRFLCLSATIPNAEEFADWISSIHSHKVDVVRYEKRAVPLEHFVYDIEIGLGKVEDLKEKISEQEVSSRYMSKKKYKEYMRNVGEVSHVAVIKDLVSQNFIPAIFFVFSRKACLVKAKELAKEVDLLTPEEKAQVTQICRKMIPDTIEQMNTTRDVRKVLSKGIGVHNAGLLPILKEVVEILFSKGLIKVLYTTETFAVGINMPAKTVLFSSLEKYDGFNFRYLNTKEYFQLAGRAGRRGIDNVGRSIVLINRRRLDIDKVKSVMDKDIEPIKSQFTLSYNTVLNLIKSHNEEEINTILKSNFGFFQEQKNSPRQMRIFTSYKNKVKQLLKMGYLTEDNKLTWKGNFASSIYSNEILVSEIAYSGLLEKMDIPQIVALMGAIIYESRISDRFKMQKIDKRYAKIIEMVSEHSYIYKTMNRQSLKKVVALCYAWATGTDFESMLNLSSLVEGDLIRFFRQIIDQLEQIKHATDNPDLSGKLSTVVAAIDRDVIKVEF
ncbi:DEAD/DEAH box helicase [Candidatus Woesearchaeota archaeon]|nr:DEAD/DEAH box helicase [Candidatus Woesearchaeota archaeon]